MTYGLEWLLTLTQYGPKKIFMTSTTSNFSQTALLVILSSYRDKS